ncbi:PIG-U-domain-containing protein [Martensiomyces pterosporus]|nr:PIG-U-domain-containing protein [Martensiomyces pterosporus]
MPANSEEQETTMASTTQRQTAASKTKAKQTSKPAAAAAAERGRLAWVIMAGSAVRLALLLVFPQAISHHLSGRVELSTPVTSYRRLVEGIHLSRHGVSPYDGGIFHQSPLLLILFRILGFLPELFTDLAFIAVDALIALTLAKIAGAKRTLPHFAQRPAVPGETSFLGSPPTVAMLYLFNPLTLCTMLVKSTILFSHLAIVTALYTAMHGMFGQAIVCTALATHLSLYPAVLVAPIALMAGRKQQTLARAAALTLGKFLAAAAAIHLLLVCVYGAHYFGATFDFTLRVADLQPNVGLFWYFFIEIFDEFRPFFFVVFQLTALAFAVPVSWRFRDDPLFGGVMLVGIISALKSYPSWGDLSLFLGLLPVFEELFKYLQYTFLSTNLLMYGIGLAPVFWHLWIEQGSGNANFFYAATLVYVFGQITLLFDLGSAMLRRGLDIRQPEARTRPVIQE